MWPVQIVLIIPFIRLGQFVFSLPSSHHTVEEIIYMSQNSFFKMLGQISFELLCGLGGWLLVAVPVSIGIYWLTLLILKMASKRADVL